MDNDDAIVGRILSRREALGLAAKAGLSLAGGGFLFTTGEAELQAKAQREVQLVASPALTEGPFFVDEKLQRSDLVSGTTRSSVVDAVPLTLDFTIYKMAAGRFSPLKGAMVDVWHCDSAGVYSDESNPMNHEDTGGQKWLRGYQISDADGLVKFKTIFPGWYMGRTTHIHFKVRLTNGDSSKGEFTSQLFFDDAVADRIYAQSPYRPRGEGQTRNASDNIFSERQVDGRAAGDHLTLELAKAKSGAGYAAKFAIALTDESFRSRRGGGPGGPGRGGWGWGGPPPKL